jgi:hypothetical protein
VAGELRFQAVFRAIRNESAGSRLILVTVLCLCVTPRLNAGTIVVSNHEWMFSNSFIHTNNDVQFAKNVGNLVVGGSGNILILSGNFGLTESTFLSLLSSQGYTYTQTSTVPGSFAGPFLNKFGLSLASTYNGVSGNVSTSAFQSQAPYGAALFTGVNLCL